MGYVVDEVFYPCLIEPMGLSRLRWPSVLPLRLDQEAALKQLHDAGLQATSSRMDPGSILGGRRRIQTNIGSAYEEAFWIEPNDLGFLAKVTGPGNFSDEWQTRSSEEAVAKVIDVYRRRDETKSATES